MFEYLPQNGEDYLDYLRRRFRLAQIQASQPVEGKVVARELRDGHPWRQVFRGGLRHWEYDR